MGDRAPASVVWDHLTNPTKRPEWQRLVTEVLPMTEGRRSIGTVNHCMHGPDVIVEHVADWRPFSYITLRYDVAGISGWAWTYQLDELDDGTRLTMRPSDPGNDAWSDVGEAFTANVADQSAQLEALPGPTIYPANVGDLRHQRRRRVTFDPCSACAVRVK